MYGVPNRQRNFSGHCWTEQADFLLKGVQAWMWVPVAVKNRVIGSVGVAHVERDYFTAHHADLALTVANQAAIALINAELFRACPGARGNAGTPATGAEPARCRQSIALFRRFDRGCPAALVGPGPG